MKKKYSLKIIFLGAVAAVLFVIIIAAVAINVSGSDKKYDTHIEMAQKYLDELDYEQAVVELRMAIEIEPNNSAAYLALAEVYVTKGDYENALAVLEEGYAATGDTELSIERERIAREYAELQEQQAELERKKREQRMKEFYEKYAELYTLAQDEVLAGGIGEFDRYLTFAEREQAYGELAEQLEQYLADLGEIEGLPEGLYDGDWDDQSVENIIYFTSKGAYSCLAGTYLRMGKLEECLRVRTEWAAFCDRPDLVQDGNHGYYEDVRAEYDRYGRCICWKYDDLAEETFVYGEFHDAPTHRMRISTGSLQETDYTYDNEGRISHRYNVYTDEYGVYISDYYYSYTGNNSFVITSTSIAPNGDTHGPEQWDEQFYDKYGREIYP